MAINTLEYAKIFMTELDKQMAEISTTGWMEANAGKVKYSGGDEVKIPQISTTGMGDYDRDNGFVQGGVTYKYKTHTMTMDRGTSFQLDAMDVDETNFVVSAGNVMGEFQRLQVVPEIDAYRYSKIAALAAEHSRTETYTPSSADILKKLLYDVARIQDVAGSGVQLMIIMPYLTANVLDTADGINRVVDVGDFAQGGVNHKVKMMDGNPIIRVPSERMKTAYTFFDGKTTGQEQGGIQQASDAKDINWIITARTTPLAVSKADVSRIFDPMTNQKAHAWRIDYRRYHDLWIAEKQMDGVWVNLGA